MLSMPKLWRVSSVLVVACGAARSGLDPAVANAPPTEPPPIRTVTITPRPCEAEDVAPAPVRCAWTAVTAARGAVARTAVLDCGFRGRTPTPVGLAVVAHRPEGDFLLAEDGAVEALPPHDALVVTPSGPITFRRTGVATKIRSRRSCEEVELPGALEGAFSAGDGSIRGWIDGRPAARRADGAWSIAEEEPAVAALDARAPHMPANGMDARVFVLREGESFRVVAQRWGFPAVVVTQTEPHVQPVALSWAPPRSGAGPRAPAVVLRDGVRLVAGDNGSVMRKTEKLALHVPDASRGYRELDVAVGEQRHDCSQTYGEGDSHPSRAESDYTDGAALARTVDDALWLVTRRHHEECAFVLDPRPEIEREGPGHPPPPRLWRGVPSVESDAIAFAALDETSGRTGSALRVPVTLSKDGGATWLAVGASGTRVLAVLGGFAVWIDASKVSR